jgi:hypothetical protein
MSDLLLDLAVLVSIDDFHCIVVDVVASFVFLHFRLGDFVCISHQGICV